jgi:hypothetical protein
MHLGLAMLFALAAGAAWAGEPAPQFTRMPSAAADGDRVKVEFAVSRATDVAVCVSPGTGRTTWAGR